MLLDGPQGWKDPLNGEMHSRICERELNTPAKTGLPGEVKPKPYTGFVSFSVAVFDELDALGWPRLASSAPSLESPVAVESFPMAAWRCLQLAGLPAKARATRSNIEDGLRRLQEKRDIRLAGTQLSHDQMQALVAGVGGTALVSGDVERYRLVGRAPFRFEGTWREGFILTPC
jgi:hypothetical protein